MTRTQSFARFFVVVALLGAVAFLRPSLQTSPANTQGCFAWSNQIPLQNAVNANACVQVAAGTWTIPRSVILPAGHTLRGDPAVARTQVILRAAEGWPTTGGDGLVNDDLSGGAVGTVKHMTLDGLGRSTGGVAARHLRITDVVIRNGRCWGIAIVGPRMTVESSLIERNGAYPGCPSAPGGGMYIAQRNPGGAPNKWAPRIVDNQIRNNTGPGVDIASVSGGYFAGNTVRGNSSWAGLSLFGSNWTIENNSIYHPATDEGQPYQRPCRGGPNGVHSAAIMVCQLRDTSNDVSVNNVIRNNNAAGWYGIQLIGNDEMQPYWTPRSNTITGNNVVGSVHGCVDDFRPGQWFGDKNTWSGCTVTHF